MNSLDFLTPREVISDCIRLAAIPSLGVALVGGIAWAVMAYLGQSTDEEPGYALLMPFVFSAVYGNAVIYNVRWKHGVRVMRGHWWYRLTGLALAWTASWAALGIAMNAALIHFGVLDRDWPSVQGMALCLLAATGLSVVMSLLPAKEQWV